MPEFCETYSKIYLKNPATEHLAYEFASLGEHFHVFAASIGVKIR